MFSGFASATEDNQNEATVEQDLGASREASRTGKHTSIETLFQLILNLILLFDNYC